MKNQHFLISTIIVTTLFIGCSKDYEQSVLSDSQTAKNYDAVAKVSSSDAITEFLKGSEGNLTRYDTGSCVDFQENFVSMMDVSEVIDNEPVTYYDLNEFDELVPNTDLAFLLNTKGEIQVGDLMYRITQAGTYYFAPSLRGKVDSMIEELDKTEGTAIGEWTVELAEGIMRYNTFEQSKETDKVAEPDGYMNATDWGNGYGRTESGAVNYVSTRALPAPALDGNRRLKGKLYYYDYLFYSEMGVTGKFQKNQLIGWSKVNADEMRIFWNDIMVEIKVPSDPGSWTAWLQSISGKAKGLPLKSAKCMIEARRGNEWMGVILAKRFD